MLPRRLWQAERHLAGFTPQRDVRVRLRKRPHAEAAHWALCQIGRSLHRLSRLAWRLHENRTLAHEMLRGRRVKTLIGLGF
jgi:hypothetical protein